MQRSKTQPKLEDEFIIVTPKSKSQKSNQRPQMKKAPAVSTLDELESIINKHLEPSNISLEPIQMPEPIMLPPVQHVNLTPKVNVPSYDAHQKFFQQNPLTDTLTIRDRTTDFYRVTNEVFVIPLKLLGDGNNALPDCSKNAVFLQELYLVLHTKEYNDVSSILQDLLKSVSLIRENGQLVADWEFDPNFWMLTEMINGTSRYFKIHVGTYDTKIIIALPVFNKERFIPFFNDESIQVAIRFAEPPQCELTVSLSADLIVTNKPISQSAVIPRLHHLVNVPFEKDAYHGKTAYYYFDQNVDFFVNGMFLIGMNQGPQVEWMYLKWKNQIMLESSSFDERAFETMGLTFVDDMDENTKVYPLTVANIRAEKYINLRGTVLAVGYTTSDISTIAQLPLYCLSYNMISF